MAGQGPHGYQALLHPDDPDYDATVAQVWFQDEGAAARAFFTPWRKSARRE
ncbi:conserved exported/membrane domain protein [Mycobacterium kansasii]|uniref:Conserved exported/membrane domain protein n=1 Tax=Mycobacterium kansasii TaxID=1768 RepID=A0A1V3X7I4_MYCKA|nr:conserved exported/membrane domain protein [Mycobacterium kansasii]OOK75067.1 conserved exported/membrane domain protein [Mycobacterium kansasii]